MVPLCVDLDGTLIKNDTTYAALFNLLRKNPLNIFRCLAWLLKGRAHCKQQLAQRTELDPKRLPYNLPFLAFLKEEKQKGRLIYLATAADQKIADRIAEHVGLFDGVIASNGNINLKSHAKRAELDKRFGIHQYDYAGNDTPDLIVWKHARKAIVVNASLKLRFMNLCSRKSAHPTDFS